MANTCTICGASVNIFQGQKLADGSYICRKTCRKKGLKYFDYASATLSAYKAHAAQVERGTKIWQDLFVPHLRDKTIKREFFPVYIAPEFGLLALVETRYKFMNFGKSEHACVYRLDDLVGYDTETETKTVDGKPQTLYFVHFIFRRADGMADFRVEYRRAVDCAAVAKYLNTLFGIQKTLGNSLNNAKRQTDAIKGIADAIGAAAKDAADAGERANDAFDKLDAAIYGDRSALTAKADAALAAYGG